MMKIQGMLLTVMQLEFHHLNTIERLPKHAKSPTVMVKKINIWL